MKRELIDATPIRAAFERLRDAETAAGILPSDDPAVKLLREVRIDFEKAIADAENVDYTPGLTVAEYLRLNGGNRSTVYKRIARGRLPVKRDGRKVFIVDPAA